MGNAHILHSIVKKKKLKTTEAEKNAVVEENKKLILKKKKKRKSQKIEIDIIKKKGLERKSKWSRSKIIKCRVLVFPLRTLSTDDNFRSTAPI